MKETLRQVSILITPPSKPLQDWSEFHHLQKIKKFTLKLFSSLIKMKEGNSMITIGLPLPVDQTARVYQQFFHWRWNSEKAILLLGGLNSPWHIYPTGNTSKDYFSLDKRSLHLINIVEHDLYLEMGEESLEEKATILSKK